jgi:hypothetical protein
MRYCYNCNHITVGNPLFCNACGKSYNVKLCPRLHTNPRTAEVCSQCGSRDLSTPQPRVPLWVPIAELLLSLVPGIVLAVVSIVAFVGVLIAILRNPQMLVALIFLGFALGILWWAWSKLPLWFRSAVYRLLKRRRERDSER